MKYFVHKIQEDWKDELKKIPEDRLKKWMDDELFIKMGEIAQNAVEQFIVDIDSSWDNEAWMDINDFVNDYAEELEKLEAEEEVEPEDEYLWAADDENEEGEEGFYYHKSWFEEYDENEEDEEVILMHCPDVLSGCNCDHAEVHPFGIGCNTGCNVSYHTVCVRHNEEQTEYNDDVPDEIAETGGL